MDKVYTICVESTDDPESAGEIMWNVAYRSAADAMRAVNNEIDTQRKDDAYDKFDPDYPKLVWKISEERTDCQFIEDPGLGQTWTIMGCKVL
jgi:hypothetical protein